MLLPRPRFSNKMMKYSIKKPKKCKKVISEQTYK